RLFQFLSQGWIVSTIGIIALIILIWIGGPYLGLGDSRPLETAFNRLIATIVILSIWALNNLRLRVTANKSNSEIINSLVAAPTPSSDIPSDVSAEEIAVLHERFTEALQHLKPKNLQDRLFGKQYLYELPWYVIIGPPGCGKTTLLESSGLEFPLAEYSLQKKISGVGGTRNCDWWFTNEAVLIDTAGRYVTQDSDAEVDSGAWLGFLDLLGKQRPRRPLNGIMVAISIKELLTESPQQKEFHAFTIRQRIEELYSRLNIRLPIYLLVTKVDLIAGFSQFFDDFSKEQRAQVWGISLPTNNQKTPDSLSRLFCDEFDALLKQLNSRLSWRLYQERAVNRREAINGFPHQFAALKPLLQDFLEKTFSPSRYGAHPWLRGIYFSSGTQEGSPIDRIMGSISSSLGIGAQSQPAFQGHSRSFFINRMFKDIMFPEAELTTSNVRYEKQRLWLERGAYVGAAGLTVAIIIAWSASFTQNELSINKLGNRIDSYNELVSKLESQPSLTKIRKLLQTAKDITQVYDGDDSTPWLMGMGLYQGLSLGAAAQQAYERILQAWLIPYIKQRLENRLLAANNEPETLRKLLSVYVMLGSPETLDINTFRPWVQTDWKDILKGNEETLMQLASNLDELIDTGIPAQQLDPSIIEKSQLVVCDIPLDQQIYARLQQQAEANIKRFRLKDISRSVNKVLVRKKSRQNSISGFYSYDGYHKIFDKEGKNTAQLTIAENRRICENKQKELAKVEVTPLLRIIRERYLDDYVDQWNNYLDSIELVKINNLNTAVDVLGRLSDRESPLDELVRVIAMNTILERAQLKSLVERFDIGQTLNKPSNRVEREFQDVHRLLQETDDNPPKLKELGDLLQELYAYTTELADASDQNEAAFEAAKKRMSSGSKDAVRLLRAEVRRLPKPVSRLIDSAATQTWGVVLGAARAHINTIWRSSVQREYKSRLENRYPLFLKGRQQISLADFGQFFGEGGSIEEFVNAYLTPFVDTRRWRLRSVDNRNLGISSASLRQFKRAYQIKEMFFQDGGQQPMLRFKLKPLYLDARVKRFVLDLNGKQLTYQHGPPRTTKLEWPGPDDNNSVRVIFERIDAGSFGIVKDGPWALFELLDASTLKKRSGKDRIDVNFSTAGFDARYQIQASSVLNPFSNTALKKFRSPGRL
ncbi:MAG: type VI secretion system membrane subunit TssM, partial [Thiohalomonadales bacterium]